jgi:hypothetical protein
VAGYGIFGPSNVAYMLPGKDNNIFVLAFTRRNFVQSTYFSVSDGDQVDVSWLSLFKIGSFSVRLGTHF